MKNPGCPWCGDRSSDQRCCPEAKWWDDADSRYDESRLPSKDAAPKEPRESSGGR